MKQHSGFSLLELMVVIAMVGVLAAVATPNFVAYRNNQRLNASVREVFGAMKETRLRAIGEQQRTIIIFDVDNGSYFAFVNDGAGTEDTDKSGIPDGAENHAFDPDEPVFLRGTLPGDIQMLKASFANGGVPRAEFDSRGMAVGFGGNVVLGNSRGNSQKITLRISGSMNIEAND